MNINIGAYLIGLVISITLGLISYSIKKMRRLNYKEIICGIILTFISWTLAFVVFKKINFRTYDFIEYID